MRWTISSFWGPAAGMLALSAISIAASLAPLSPSHAQPAQSGPELAIDADATGNTPTSLGQRDVCIEVKSGDTFDVDVTMQNIEELIAFEAYVKLDVSMVNVMDRDASLFLSSASETEAFDLSESVPETSDENGLFRVGAGITTGDGVTSASGSGVLARLNLRAVGPGVSVLSARPVERDVGTIAATFTSVDDTHIGDSDGDSFFDGSILDALVAVDQNCPSDAEGPIAVLIGGGGGDGVPSWVFVAAAAGIVAAAGFGGMALIRMRRTGSRGVS